MHEPRVVCEKVSSVRVRVGGAAEGKQWLAASEEAHGVGEIGGAKS